MARLRTPVRMRSPFCRAWVVAPALHAQLEAGGVLCEGCAARLPARRIPADARRQLTQWLERDGVDCLVGLELLTERAHRRLLHSFVHAHLTDGRPLRAFDAWATA